MNKNDLKVTKSIKVNEIIEVEGSFFYIAKHKIKDCYRTKNYTKYFLKVVARKEKVDLVTKLTKSGEIEKFIRKQSGGK